MSPLLIEPKRMPSDGLQLEGQLSIDLIQIENDQSVSPQTPLTYELDVQRDDEGLIVTGEIAATFQLQCGRCAENFLTEIRLSPYFHDVVLKNDLPFDLTNTLREDILLALPNYPRCETSTVSPRECPAEGRFEPNQEPLSDDLDPDQRGNAWEALDQFKQPKQS
ncbi:hypothetical protein FEM03_16960 [Phragmitibacter flavus]|uniref:DUF177 domain-containing protein n=1 Tax=Phragmitibacter flavus TaxID=2576071 RepID=A0A5R8KBL6_9BACT|nr:hypothetical protein [Phragmitibacter flavus]TLD69647.1 hypothetical protein FEM03_16960 [Phragmitibacter flavus]